MHDRPSLRAVPVTDESLVGQIANGHTESLGELYDRFNGDVFAFAARIAATRGPELDDIVQATFLAARSAAHTFSGRSSVRTWVLGIAANVTRNHIRRESRRRNVIRTLALIPTACVQSPAEVADHRETLRRVAAAIERLPLRLRVPYVLCIIEGVSTREAAHVLSIRAGTLSRRVHEARKQLKKAVKR